MLIFFNCTPHFLLTSDLQSHNMAGHPCSILLYFYTASFSIIMTSRLHCTEDRHIFEILKSVDQSAKNYNVKTL